MREWLLLAFAPLATACTEQGLCETTPPFVEYCALGDPNCQGHIIDATHWESVVQDGDFLSYGAEEVIHMTYRDHLTGDVLVGKQVAIEVQVSSVQKGDTPGNNFVLGSLQLVTLTDDPNGQALYVRNDTCGSYFLRVIVTIDPFPLVVDGGTEAGSDATTDAASE